MTMLKSEPSGDTIVTYEPMLGSDEENAEEGGDEDDDEGVGRNPEPEAEAPQAAVPLEG
jgi:hypothetical protein